MYPQDARNLLTKYVKGKCSEYEISLIHTWYYELIKDSGYSEDLPLDENDTAKAWQALLIRRKERHRQKVLKITYSCVAAAAALTGIIIVACNYLPAYHYEKAPLAVTNILTDIPPGTDRGTLLLASGKEIDLQSASDGELANVNGHSIRKEGNQIVCRRTSNGDDGGNDDVNILKVPNAGQYSIVLEDDSRIELNAGSSLSFPTSFAKSRSVKLSGEGYFRITGSARNPFKIEDDHQTISVLGTRFNVSAYKDEEIATTLVDGKVSIRNALTGKEDFLSPGYQLLVKGTASLKKVVHTDEVIGWTEGLFIFTDMPLRKALKQIGRWYDVQIDMTNIDGNKLITAQLKRSDSLNNLIKNIRSATGVQLKLEARTLKAV